MFSYQRKARYHETDQMGVVHHSNYVKWMEESRTEFLESIGAGYAKIEAGGIVSPVVSLSVEYKNPVRFDETVDISVYVKKYTGVELIFSYEFVSRDTGALCTRTESRHCFLSDGRVASLRKKLPEYDRAMREYAAAQDKEKNNEE